MGTWRILVFNHGGSEPEALDRSVGLGESVWAYNSAQRGRLTVEASLLRQIAQRVRVRQLLGLVITS